ncbi:MAG: glycosyltransferase [Methanobacteriaceae archaeon]
MISVLCVYNDPEILNKYLLSSLKLQEAKYDLILLDNTQNQYSSAAQALNQGAKKATGEYLMFAHQDIDLVSPTFLNDLENTLDSTPHLGIGGVAGKKENNPEIISNITDGTPPQKVSTLQVEHPTRVQTVDECLFVIPHNRFNEIELDELVCDGWHLYAVDFSLSVAVQGYDVYVFPFSLYHKSRGYSLSRDYFQTLTKLVNKHRQQYGDIHTTMWNWNTKYPLTVQIIWQQLYWNWTMLKEKLNLGT